MTILIQHYIEPDPVPAMHYLNVVVHLEFHLKSVCMFITSYIDKL